MISGPIDPKKSQFVNQGSVVVGCEGRAVNLTVEPRDCFDNLCEYSSENQLHNKFRIAVTEVEHALMVILCVYTDN